MIPIDPEPAPRVIETARARRFPEVLAGFAGSRVAPTREELGDAYQVAKEPRWQHQREKCAYCDRQYPVQYAPTEHFRPVLGGYWWLAWDWENLVFACASCNGAKGNAFDLLPGCVALRPGERPPGQERPALINPLQENPLAAITFVKEPDGWVPRGTDADGRGEAMIKAVGLLQHFNVHQDHVSGVTLDIQRVSALVTAAASAGVRGPTADIAAEFLLFKRRNYNDRSILRSLTWAVWNDAFPTNVQQDRQIELPPPRTPPLPLTPERARELALLASLTVPTREHIYRLGGNAPPVDWNMALTSILNERPFFVEEIAVLTGSSEKTVLLHLRRLETAGRVTLTGAGRTRRAERR